MELENLLDLAGPSVTLRIAISSEAERRARNLASLRRAILAGTYRVSAALIADAIVLSAYP
jgi:anti-sigma28 factor (negative regulator of flagellin synthesis)